MEVSNEQPYRRIPLLSLGSQKIPDGSLKPGLSIARIIAQAAAQATPVESGTWYMPYISPQDARAPKSVRVKLTADLQRDLHENCMKIPLAPRPRPTTVRGDPGGRPSAGSPLMCNE